MNTKVISIQKQFEPILAFLFPTYSIGDGIASTSKFITHRNITSKNERDVIDIRYDDCIFISTQIFDEVWDEDKIKEECIKFSHAKFKNRKIKFEATSETFIQDCLDFIFGTKDEKTESTVTELFDTFGSNLFLKKYLQLSQETSYQVLSSALNTFVSKVLSDTTSIYYKKKKIILESKIRENLIKAIDSYNLRTPDSFGLSDVKFYLDLFQQC